MTQPEERPRHALLPEPRAGDERPRAARQRGAGLAPRSSSSRTSTSRSRRTTPSRSSTAATSTPILYADRAQEAHRARPALPRAAARSNVRAKIRKSVGRPADIYSLGAMFYYLVERRLREPEDALRRLPQVHRVRAPDETNTIEGVPRPRVLRSSSRCARPRAPGRRGRGARRPVLHVQALPRRQRRAHRAARDEDHRQVHDPQQAGQLLPGARRRDARHQRCSCRTSSTSTRSSASTRRAGPHADGPRGHSGARKSVFRRGLDPHALRPNRLRRPWPAPLRRRPR